MRVHQLGVTLVTGLGLVAGAVSCGGMSGDRPTTAGTIFFLRGEGSLMTMSADGSQQRPVSDDIVFDYDLSTNGQRIVFDGGDDYISGIDGIYLMDVASPDARRLPLEPCYGPVLSPDGRRIACEYTEPHWITVGNADGSGVRRITPDCCYRPSWSPDGRKIAYLSFGRWSDEGVTGPSGVFVMNADGRDKHRVSAHGFDDHQPPEWSPDGRMLAYLSDDSIWVVDLERSTSRRLLHSPDRGTKDLAWSPDGKSLAFTHGDGDFEIFVVNLDGSGLRNLTDNERVHDESPSWSPDGTAIVFASTRDDTTEIYAMRADGSARTRLTESAAGDPYPVWSAVELRVE